MTPPDYITTLSHSLAASKRQAYFPSYFGANEQGPITELFQKLLLCGVADLAIQQHGGNLVEIGAAEGKASVALAEVAKRHGKRLLVIDPYNGQQEGTEALFAQFKAAVAPYGDTVIHLRASSHEPSSVQQMVDTKPCFVFVDGLHYEWAAYHDIRAAHLALPVGGWVCVDDTNMLTKDAGAAFSRAGRERLFDIHSLDEDTESVLYRYKSWHWGVKR